MLPTHTTKIELNIIVTQSNDYDDYDDYGQLRTRSTPSLRLLKPLIVGTN